MPTTKLKSIELKYFRGATRPVKIEFVPDKKVTMIYGENGCGKSSVVDAFDFLCQQDFGSLNDRKGADKDLLTSITGNSDYLRVKLTTDTGAWEAQLKPGTKNIVVKPNTGCPDARILRRSNILRLIDEIPSKRFEALKEYIDVSAIEKSEKALGDAIRNKEGELQRSIQAYAQAESSLIHMWQAEKAPGKSAEKWAELESAKDATQLQAEANEVGECLTVITDLERQTESRERTLKRVTDADAANKIAIEEQKAEEKKVIGENPVILDLLRRARDFVGRNPSATCPVCQQPADSVHLAKELEKRIASMAVLTTATNKTDLAKKALDTANAQLAGADSQLFEAAEKAVQRIQGSKLPPITSAALPAEEFGKIADASMDSSARVEAALKILTVFESLKNPLESHRESAKKTIAQRFAIASQLNQMQTNRASQETTAALIAKLQATLKIVGDTRKAFVKEVLDTISTEVESLFGKLHPKESLGGIKLSLDPNNFGSLHLHGDFHSAKGVPPQSVFSESHLDTLGLCVFLALAKHYKTENTIIILDDVMTSVDREHLDRFIDLLHDEEKHFSQFIVTTHYQPWRDRYRNHRAPGGQVHFIELRPWSLGAGIRVQGMKLCLDELRQVMATAPFDRQAVASKSGIFLENMLEFLARMYACKLPLTSHSGYTLRELTDSFSSKLLKLLKVERITVVKDAAGVETSSTSTILLDPIITQIKGLATVRNQVGCHYNFEASNVSDKEVEELGMLTVTFGEALVCNEHGDLPSRNRSGSYHESRSGKVRLHPFDQPN